MSKIVHRYLIVENSIMLNQNYNLKWDIPPLPKEFSGIKIIFIVLHFQRK